LRHEFRRPRLTNSSVIAVTGLAGHAFGSWAYSETIMWLRDYLPEDAPEARILTYGYRSNPKGSNVSVLQDHTNTFVQRLIAMRDLGGVSLSVPSL
jgi:hypothetical protein